MATFLLRRPPSLLNVFFFSRDKKNLLLWEDSKDKLPKTELVRLGYGGTGIMAEGGTIKYQIYCDSVVVVTVNELVKLLNRIIRFHIVTFLGLISQKHTTLERNSTVLHWNLMFRVGFSVGQFLNLQNFAVAKKSTRNKMRLI